MGYKPPEAKAVSANFLSFLWQAISKIREAEDEGDFLLALSRACSLVKYLPVRVKDKLWENVEEIRAVLSENYNVESRDFHSGLLLKNKTMSNLAQAYFHALMNKMMRLLDETGIYIEYRRTDVEFGREIPTS